jgi:type II secretion system protein J
MSLLRHGRRAAFTLVEIMVSMVILALVVSAIYASWYAIIKGSRAAQGAAADVQRLRIAMQTLEQSFIGARLFAGNLDLYSFEVDSSGDYSAISFASKLPRSFPRSGRFGDFDVRRVTFTVESGNGRDNELVLRQSPLLMVPDADEEQNPLVLARHVNLFTVEFWDTNKFEWQDKWTLTNQLPKMVRVHLGIGNKTSLGTQSGDDITRVVALSATAVPQIMQSPRIGPGGQPRQPPGGATNQPARGLFGPGSGRNPGGSPPGRIGGF